MPKILIIEDDKFLANMYVEKLTNDGFTALSTISGKKGITLAKTEKPDLILLDILLPDLDGYQVLKKIKEDKDCASIPVIMLTNLSENDQINQAIDLGAVDYLIKAHFMPSEVVQKIKNALRKQLTF